MIMILLILQVIALIVLVFLIFVPWPDYEHDLAGSDAPGPKHDDNEQAPDEPIINQTLNYEAIQWKMIAYY